MRNDPVYLRGRIYWCKVRNEFGRIVRKSTKCRDRQAAIVEWRNLERKSVEPPHQAAHKTPLRAALDERIAERESAGRAKGTIGMLKVKARQLTRVLGAETPLARIDAREIDRFVAVRLEEGAARTTVHKELVTLRGALKLARRRRAYPFEVSEVMPLDFAAKYEPRTRALSLAEIAKLLTYFAPKPERRAVLAFLLATGATYPSEVQGARKGDATDGYVLLRGTKREGRHRRVPIVPHARGWMRLARRQGPPFVLWTNIRRDLHVACDELKLARVSPNDLRRTFGRLLRAQGVEPQLIAPAMGHADGRMVERVYGRLSPEELSHLLHARLRSGARVQNRHTRRKTA